MTNLEKINLLAKQFQETNLDSNTDPDFKNRELAERNLLPPLNQKDPCKLMKYL